MLVNRLRNLAGIKVVSNDSPNEDHTRISDIKYVGISDLSVEIHFTDNSAIRITPADYREPLRIKKMEGRNVV